MLIYMTNGFIYIASNNVGGLKHDYIKEAIYSATSLKKKCPNANITLFTDKPVNNKIFDQVNIVKMELRCKQKYLLESPYEKTVYIDSDTYINYNIEDMFIMLDKFELLCCNDFARKRNLQLPEYMKIPYAFSELNGGIIGYKKCDNFKKMVKLWNHYYYKYRNVMPWDQPSFRIAVWESNINLYVLPIEYNRRGLHTKAKVVNCKKQGDPRFGKDHLVTRIFHFHNIENLTLKDLEKKAQHL